MVLNSRTGITVTSLCQTEFNSKPPVISMMVIYRGLYCLQCRLNSIKTHNITANISPFHSVWSCLGDGLRALKQDIQAGK